MKKIAAFLLSAALLLGFAGCSESAPAGSLQNPEPTATPEPVVKQIGDTITCTQINGAEMEYTVTKVQLFDHYTDAGIAKEDCVFGLKDTTFVLVDVQCKKISGPEWKTKDDYDQMAGISLSSKELMKDRDTALSPEMCYFSGHDEVQEGEKSYDWYWLDPGETKTYQLGWCLYEEGESGLKDQNVKLLTKTDGLVLQIGIGSYDDPYVDLGT